MPFDFDEMKSGLGRLLQSPGLGVIVIIVSLVLIVLGVKGLNDRLPSLPSATSEAPATTNEFPLVKIEKLLAKDTFTRIPVASNGTHAFYTRHFEPPPPPPPKPVPPPEPVPTPPPQPPPPTTRKAALLFQGVYQGATGSKKAFVQVETALHILTNGAKVIGDWSIADISVRKLTLTNGAAQTNILEFNAAKELEVPLK